MIGALSEAASGRGPADTTVLWACMQVAVAFCELLDAGDAVEAFGLHDPELRFHPPGAPRGLTLDEARGAGERMLHAYPGRRTAHLLSNFVAARTADDLVEAQYVVTVYELTAAADGGARERDVPVVFALAHERAVFRRGNDGAWRYLEQRMLPIAPLNPFAGGGS